MPRFSRTIQPLLRGTPLALLVLLLAIPATVQAQGGAGNRPLTHDDYDSWKSIRGQLISPNGRWIVYQIVPQDGDGELVVRSVRTTTEYRHARGGGARFTDDSDYVIFMVAPPEDSLEAAEQGPRRPGAGPGGPRGRGRQGGRAAGPKSALTIMSLSDGRVTTVERVKNFKLPEEAGGWVAYLMEEPVPEEPEEGERE